MVAQLHQFNAAPLPRVWLRNGYESETVAGRTLIRYLRLNELLSALLQAVILKPALLSGKEIAYLRRKLDLAQDALADVLGCTEQTLSLWERGQHPITRSADTVLRKLSVESNRRNLGRSPSRSAYNVAALARLGRNRAEFMYECSLAGRSWVVSYTPVFTHSAQDVSTGPLEILRYVERWELPQSATSSTVVSSPARVPSSNSDVVRWQRPGSMVTPTTDHTILSTDG